jgi:hypothetical protein
MSGQIATVVRTGVWLAACVILLATARSLGATASLLVATLAASAAGAAAVVFWPRRARPSGALAAPVASPRPVVREPLPLLWAPASEPVPDESAVADPSAAEPAAPAPAGAPPDPELGWGAEIRWGDAGGNSRFHVMARTGPNANAISLGCSDVLAWPPSGPASVQALTHAVKTLEADLVAAGWMPLPSTGAWYAKRFAWVPGGQPVPPPGRARHRALYDAEYARQVQRTQRLRTAIEAEVLVRPARNGHGPRSPEPTQLGASD